MRVPRSVLLGTLVLATGCGVIAGIQELEYQELTEPAPETDATSPVEEVDASIPEPAELDAGDEPTIDAGGEPPPPCTTADFQANDRRGAKKARLITFAAGDAPAPYAPRCMMIRAGQTVTWEGAFRVDPLEAQSQSPPSPITLTAAGNTATFTFVEKGRYRYGSTANLAMRGALDVRP